jgi:hypothetical protein
MEACCWVLSSGTLFSHIVEMGKGVGKLPQSRNRDIWLDGIGMGVVGGSIRAAGDPDTSHSGVVGAQDVCS